MSLLKTFKLTADFGRFAIGTLQTPYETYRGLAQKEDIRFLPFIALFVLLYLFLAGLVKGGLAMQPLFLTASFIKIVSGIVLSFSVSVFLLGILGTVIKGDVDWRRITVLWAFSLLPTCLWFIVTSLFSFVLPPPRTTSILGQLASSVFIALSVGLFLWKGILYYLTLRFGLRISLGRIILVSSLFLPLLILYSIGMYKLGIFRVPFL